MPKKPGERVLNGPHPFWMATCGLNTHATSPRHARNDTPWTSFTANGKALVCTLWADLVATVYDPLTKANRRFVVLGGRSQLWQSGAIERGRIAHEELRRARDEKIPVYGFEVTANLKGSPTGARTIKHAFLDRAHLLQQHFGPRGDDLKRRLSIIETLAEHWQDIELEALNNGMLFELIEPKGDVPGSHWKPGDILQPEPAVSECERLARIAIPLLVDHLRRQTDNLLVPVTDERLAGQLGILVKTGIPFPLYAKRILAAASRMIAQATAEWDESSRPPRLTAIVVSGETGEPVDEIDQYFAGYADLASGERRARVEAEHQRIMHFGDRWLSVLDALGLSPLQAPPPSRSGAGGWGGGESDAHRDLKRHILSHPEIFAVGPDADGIDEYPLLSGDRIDVMFRTPAAYVGIEVKSARSDDADLERGIYQVIKYRAVLSAQRAANAIDSSRSIQVHLAVQRELPGWLQRIAADLDVPWKLVASP